MILWNRGILPRIGKLAVLSDTDVAGTVIAFVTWVLRDS